MSTKEVKAAPASAAAAQSVGDQGTEDAVTLRTMGFGAMAGVGTTWVEVLSDMGSEVLSFVADRIKEDVKTQHEILHCKDVGELQRIQAEFIQTAMDQYATETGKLVEMSQKLLRAPATGKDGSQ
ncbi:phasin family protein [Aestuariibius sp. 2305UL40-4]|uniref:phasin family protein n=1 Tax=Aestuariibius violaceus TaxID=3234132 RepID=UPI00345E0C7A